ncbi:MAG: DUF4296 domain-containing protein [Bacteroidota bacterium]
MKRKFYLKRAEKNKFLICAVIAVSFIFSYCSQKKYPRDLLAKIYVENLVAEGKYDFNPDSLRFYQQKVFAKYKITQDQFKSALKSYQDDPKEWDGFFKRAKVMLDSLKAQSVIK